MKRHPKGEVKVTEWREQQVEMMEEEQHRRQDAQKQNPDGNGTW